MMACFQVDRMGEACDLRENLVRAEAVVSDGWAGLMGFGQNGAVTPILEAVDINVAKWVEGVERYESLTARVVGHIEAVCRKMWDRHLA
jgi:hypothetical protein